MTNSCDHDEVEALRSYDRAMLRSAFVSVFWAVISERKKAGKFTLKSLADKLGIHKSEPSRWFTEKRPNWSINTISDIAGALNVEFILRVRDRETEQIFAPHGLVENDKSAHTASKAEPLQCYDIFPEDNYRLTSSNHSASGAIARPLLYQGHKKKEIDRVHPIFETVKS
jgi:transcriptional regulator with XRE-family HTH domain